MQDLYIRVDRHGIMRASQGDANALPLAVYDAAGAVLHRCRHLPLSLFGRLKLGHMTYDHRQQQASKAHVYLLLPDAQVKDGNIELHPDPAAVAQLVKATGRLSAEEILALAAGYLPPDRSGT